MITQFVDCIDILEMDQDLVDYSTEGHTQAETMDFLTNKIAKTALEEIRKNKSNSQQFKKKKSKICKEISL